MLFSHWATALVDTPEADFLGDSMASIQREAEDVILADWSAVERRVG